MTFRSLLLLALLTRTVGPWINAQETAVGRENRPENQVAPQAVRSDSEVKITLDRFGGYWGGPTYTVTVGTGGILFVGRSYVVASGKHIDSVDAQQVRTLAQAFLDANFYSMKDEYVARNISDLSSSQLSISIDGKTKQVHEYAGTAVGMPPVVEKLEMEVEKLANTNRWVVGAEGLIPALQAENFNFQSFEGQAMLKEAAGFGATATVRALLAASVPLTPLSVPKPSEADITFFGELYRARPENVGWLQTASNCPEVLEVLIEAGASKEDQNDKDRALVSAASAGNLKSVQMLIAYGASLDSEVNSVGERRSLLIFAAESGNPGVVREILRYQPKLEARDSRGRTAMFGTDDHGRTSLGNHVECVRLLAAAGADVNARDSKGNTPLHVTLLDKVAEELLKFGADVNARNDDGETPIFTTYNSRALPILLAHGADLTIRNNLGLTVWEAARTGAEALRAAVERLKQH
jgi:ankyrin repeat protein